MLFLAKTSFTLFNSIFLPLIKAQHFVILSLSNNNSNSISFFKPDTSSNNSTL